MLATLRPRAVGAIGEQIVSVGCQALDTTVSSGGYAGSAVLLSGVSLVWG